MERVILYTNKVKVTSIDMVSMYPLAIFPLLKNNFIFQNVIIWKPTITCLSIIDTHHFGGDIHTVEIQILIISGWLGRNWTKMFINMMILIILPFWPGGGFPIWIMQQQTQGSNMERCIYIQWIFSILS